MNKILYHMHIMWYESKMLNETLDSIQNALKYSPIPVEFVFVLNSQTYLEKPLDRKPADMFADFLGHSMFTYPNLKIIYKTDDDPIYNVGDIRREIYKKDYRYTVWGESDSLLPEDLFYILGTLEIEEKHVLTFASRKMWDSTWTHVEHADLRGRRLEDVEQYLRNDVQMDQNQLNEYNSRHDIMVERLDSQKIDGSTVCISSGFDVPFVSNQGCFGEDTSFEYYLKIKEIPQYLVSTRLKGHNYKHKDKRTNTNNLRTDQVILDYKKICHGHLKKFVEKLLIEKASLTK